MMAARNKVEPYDIPESELIQKAEATAKQYCSTSDNTQIGKAVRNFAKCVDEIRAEVPAKEVDLISFKLGFLARGVLDAERHIARSVVGGNNRNEQNRYLQSRYQDLVDEETAKGKCYTEAARIVADNYGRDERTVRQYTTNKSPYKRTKRRKGPK